MNPQQLRSKLRQELVEYTMNVIYLTLVFGAFTFYRRLLLAAHDIAYAHYGVALFEALVLGKVIMIGSFLRLGRGLESKPLIYSTLYKTVLFCLLVAIVKTLELGVRGLIAGETFWKGIASIRDKGRDEVLANTLIVFVAFFPYFALKELERILGRRTIGDLFFRRPAGSSHPVD